MILHLQPSPATTLKGFLAFLDLHRTHKLLHPRGISKHLSFFKTSNGSTAVKNICVTIQRGRKLGNVFPNSLLSRKELSQDCFVFSSQFIPFQLGMVNSHWFMSLSNFGFKSNFWYNSAYNFRTCTFKHSATGVQFYAKWVVLGKESVEKSR